MARPLKSGIDYFSLDTGFLRDKKIRLIKSRFGSKGILILIALLGKIYEENGYFKPWDDDDCFLMSDDIACGCSPALVEEVVQECVKRSVFDTGVLNAFGVLTSPGIQRRFLRAVATRDEIIMIKEYFLLDLANRRDVQDSVRKKLTFESITFEKTPISFEKTPAFIPDNTQSKVKQSKVKESTLPPAESTAYIPTTDTPSESLNDPQWARVVLSYEANIGLFPTGIAQERMLSYYEDMGSDVLCYAFEYTNLKHSNNPKSYVEKVLSNWLVKNIRNLSAAKAETNDHQRRNQPYQTHRHSDPYAQQPTTPIDPNHNPFRDD